MAAKYSFVTLHNDTRKTVSRQQGIKMQQILDGNIEPDNDAQATYVLNIKRIDPLTVNGTVVDKTAITQAVRASEDDETDKTNHLTNKGIAQSMYDALPTGDR